MYMRGRGCGRNKNTHAEHTLILHTCHLSFRFIHLSHSHTSSAVARAREARARARADARRPSPSSASSTPSRRDRELGGGRGAGGIMSIDDVNRMHLMHTPMQLARYTVMSQISVRTLYSTGPSPVSGTGCDAHVQRDASELGRRRQAGWRGMLSRRCRRRSHP